MLPLLVLFSLCIPVVQGQAEEVKFCRQQKEVVFVLDGSRSVDIRNFAKVLNFTKIMIGYLDVRPEATRVAVVSFSTDAVINIGLGSYSNVEQLQEAVETVPYLNDIETRTERALNMVRESVFSSDHENYTQIVICVTDGQPTDMQSMKKEVNASEAVGIHIVAIGVGLNLQNGLNALATNLNYVYSVENFENLVTVVDDLSLQLCASECRDKKLDVALVLDRSTSVGEENFRKAVNFLNGIVNRMDIGENDTRVALLAYSTGVTVFFRLGRYNSKAEVLTQLNSISFGDGGNTNTHMALNSAKHTLTTADGSRGEESNKVAIVVTDGGSQRRTDTEDAAEQLRNAGVTVIAVAIGVGNDTNQQNELANIASPSDDPSVTYLFNTDSYDALDSILLAVTGQTCSE